MRGNRIKEMFVHYFVTLNGYGELNREEVEKFAEDLEQRFENLEKRIEALEAKQQDAS